LRPRPHDRGVDAGDRRKRTIGGNAALAVAALGASLAGGALKGEGPAVRLLIGAAGLGGYVLFARRALLAWNPDIDRMWSRRDRETRA
jgi:hypothetical protein